MDTKSAHILSTSANLLGFTFIVLTSVKALGLSRSGVIERLTGVCVILFALSTLLSFLSMRLPAHRYQKGYELTADMIFLAGLAFSVAISCLMW